jgi:hypothetical protein
MKKAVALIVKEPNEIYLDFLQGFTQYDIYIIVDSDKDLTELTKALRPCAKAVPAGPCAKADPAGPCAKADKYKMLNFIQLTDDHCTNHGFKNVNFIGIKKMVSGWDKALLFFSTIVPSKYDHVWFIEDDVFFLNEQVLTNLDSQYPNQDLIANCDFDKNNVNTNNTTNVGWLWPLISIKIEKPWYAGMMCAVRLSNTLLQCIRWYASKYNTLFFLEALFPTITSHFKLSYVNPIELTTVTYRDVFFLEEEEEEEDQERLETHIFHPMKDLNKHLELRSNK